MLLAVRILALGVFLGLGSSGFAFAPILPEDVLAPETIRQIISEENYFLYREMDDSQPITHGKKRQYSR